MKIKLKPEIWEQLIGGNVLDPDGWDRSNFKQDWEKPITLKVFREKCFESTTDFDFSDDKRINHAIISRIGLVFN